MVHACDSTSDEYVAQGMVKTLFVSSPYRSKDTIVSLNNLAAPYLAHILQNVGLMEIGDRTAEHIILGFYEQATSK